MYIVRDNQTLIDIAMQELGGCSSLPALAQANNLALDALLQDGQMLVLPPVQVREIARYFASQLIVVATQRNP